MDRQHRWEQAWELDKGLKTPHREKVACYEISQRNMGGFFVALHEYSNEP
jgi:hypothetical protein